VALAGCLCTRRVALALNGRGGIEPRHGICVEKGRAERGDGPSLRGGCGRATRGKVPSPWLPPKRSRRASGPLLLDARPRRLAYGTELEHVATSISASGFNGFDIESLICASGWIRGVLPRGNDDDTCTVPAILSSQNCMVFWESLARRYTLY